MQQNISTGFSPKESGNPNASPDRGMRALGCIIVLGTMAASSVFLASALWTVLS